MEYYIILLLFFHHAHLLERKKKFLHHQQRQQQQQQQWWRRRIITTVLVHRYHIGLYKFSGHTNALAKGQSATKRIPRDQTMHSITHENTTGKSATGYDLQL